LAEPEAEEMEDLTPRQRAVRDQFIEKRGYWAPHIECLLRLNVDLFEAHQKSSDIIWNSERLEPKVKEFIYIAIDVTVTHLYEPGLRLHINNALALGATVQEIAEVISFVSTAGLATLSMGLPLIIEEAQARGMPVEQRDSGLQRK
jgi:alkylhydroperoxidase/carboxymuconolactone decarboxylase family protein YurZ